MIRPEGFTGAAFGTSSEGDLRKDTEARAEVSAQLGIPSDWAWANQVHGATVLTADRPGPLGDGDAIVVYEARLPIMVATADCAPVIIESTAAVAVVHAGWRGAAAGVLPAAIATMEESGHRPIRAAIGPMIGPCCYEVGPEVIELFPGFESTTSWGNPSVDLPSFLANQLNGLEVWLADECTYTSKRMSSWRRDRTRLRQVAVAWLQDD